MRTPPGALVAAAATAAMLLGSPAVADPRRASEGGGGRGSSAAGAVEVVGGSPAVAGRWDDAAAVYFDDDHGCTGTLVTPDLVLTAGHCIDGITSVRLGSIDLNAPDAETIPVAEQIAYPDALTTYDVGLLILERPSRVTPRVLATGCVVERYLANGAAVAIVGWGATDEQGQTSTDQLIEARSTVTDFDCSGGRGCKASVTPAGELGAGGDDVDSCFGDSGGPLYLLTELGDYLVGVTSRGYDDAELPCGDGGIYVRADAVVDWIEEESGEEIPRATCNSAPAPTADQTRFEVEGGKSFTALLAANDPDAADLHSFALADPPAHGDARVEDDGKVTYTADDDYGGADPFAVEVRDNGVPSLSGRVEFDVTVISDGDGGCGCRTGHVPCAGSLAAALAALAPLARRRRRDR